MSNKTAAPKLRFPEFQEEWEEKNLSDFATLITEKAGENKYTMMSVTVGVGLLTQIEKFGREIAGNSYKNYFVIKHGDFAYNKSATKQYPEGYIAMYKGQGSAAVPNSIFICFRVEGDTVNLHFLDHIFSANFHGAWLRQFITIGARAHGALNVDSDDLLRMPLRIPTPNEQQKIADCLTSLDNLIAAQSQKVAALQAYKKGLMQNLFPAEGESVPRLRFPEFESAGEWEEKTLGEVATFSKGKGISKADTSPNGLHQCIRYGELYTLYKETITTVASYTNLPLEDLVLSEANDVIIPTSGETEIDIATASCVLRSGIALGGDLSIIRSEINGVFLSYYLNNAKKKDIAKLAQGIAVVHLYSNQLKTLKINVPQKHEQAKIAELLTALDEQISAQGEAVAALKVHKRGLLQGLFPNQTSEVFKTSEV